MRKLAVFDLDGTLVPGDSFSDLTRAEIWKHPALLALGAGRRLRLVGRERFAESAHRALMSKFADESFVTELVSHLVATVATERLKIAKSWRQMGAYTLLLSASPNPYIEPLAVALGFDAGIGSDWREGAYRHLYGQNKRTYLDAAFPPSIWRRVYGMADSQSDLAFLETFELADLVEPLSRPTIRSFR